MIIRGVEMVMSCRPRGIHSQDVRVESRTGSSAIRGVPACLKSATTPGGGQGAFGSSGGPGSGVNRTGRPRFPCLRYRNRSAYAGRTESATRSVPADPLVEADPVDRRIW
ncbi:MAG TPA: hypothetical protein DCE39_16070 [Planctomycetaceae bacterium]|nr:hypothetical protein [Planctomycetaceae bacterium]